MEQPKETPKILGVRGHLRLVVDNQEPKVQASPSTTPTPVNEKETIPHKQEAEQNVANLPSVAQQSEVNPYDQTATSQARSFLITWIVFSCGFMIFAFAGISVVSYIKKIYFDNGPRDAMLVATKEQKVNEFGCFGNEHQGIFYHPGDARNETIVCALPGDKKIREWIN